MIFALLKFIFAGGIIYWLLQSGKLDLSIISNSLESGTSVYKAASIYLFVILISSFRWKKILEVKTELPLKYKKVLPINWIGLFFSTFLPGVVTGDVVKLLYIKDESKEFSKTFLLTSVFIDRIIGVCGLLFVAGVTSILNYQELVRLSDEVAVLIHFNFMLFVGAVCFIIGLCLPKNVQKLIYDLCLKIPKIGLKVKTTLEQAWLLGNYKKTTFLCLGISILVQFLGITSIWILTKPYYPAPISLSLLLGIIPTGLISIAIPISPSGAGVGHVVFEKLFSLLGVPNGASLFNLHFLIIIFVNLIGVIPYIFFGKKHLIEEAEEFDQTEAPS